jgi:hypothetical protein
MDFSGAGSTWVPEYAVQPEPLERVLAHCHAAWQLLDRHFCSDRDRLEVQGSSGIRKPALADIPG